MTTEHDSADEYRARTLDAMRAADQITVLGLALVGVFIFRVVSTGQPGVIEPVFGGLGLALSIYGGYAHLCASAKLRHGPPEGDEELEPVIHDP